MKVGIVEQKIIHSFISLRKACKKAKDAFSNLGLELNKLKNKKEFTHKSIFHN